MEDKYYIVPQKSRLLSDLAKGMELNKNEDKLLKDTFIRHVEISLNSSMWEILVWSVRELPENIIKRITEFVAQKNSLAKVIIYQTVISLKEMVEPYWEKLVNHVAGNNQSIRHILLETNRIYKDSRIILQVNGDFSKYLLEENNVALAFYEAGIKIIGYPISIECQSIYEEIENISVEEILHETKEYKEALEAAQAPVNKSAQGGGSKAGGVASSDTVGKNKYSSKKFHPKRSAIQIGKDDSPLVFGEPIIGSLTPISQLEGEMKDVVVQGVIVSVDGKQLLDTNILLLSVVDDTDGITCKSFFKKQEDYTKVLDRLKKAAEAGGTVKIRGRMRYDKFDNDNVLFVDSVLLVDLESRQDKATEKRVELHCHTKLSAGDGVASAESLIKTAAKWGWPAIAITDHGVVQAFPEAMETVWGKEKLDIKIIYGVEGYLVDEDYRQDRANHIILLAKNPHGLRNLYKLITMSHLRFFYKTPRLPRQLIQEYREGLIIGSACEAGELVRAIVA